MYTEKLIVFEYKKGRYKYMKKSNILTMVICTIILSAATFCGGATAAGNKSVSYQSQGKIVFNNNTAQTVDDVIFDASDFQTIDDMVTAGKTQIGIELNKYPSINLDLNNTVPSFGDLSNAVSILTNDVNADGSKILKNYTAYVKGSKIQGTIESKAAATYTPSTSDQTINQGIYLSGAQTIKGDKNLIAANILENKTIFGVAGTHKCAVTPTQTKTVTPSTKEQTITPDTGKLLSSVTVSAISTQTKTATPGSTEQTISPDTGKYLTSVKVSAVSTQTKTATPGSTEQTISPDSGKYLSSVTVEAIGTQTKSVTPGASEQTVSPDEGKYLSSVTVAGDEDLLAGNIKSGVEIFGVTGTLIGNNGNSEKISGTTTKDYSVIIMMAAEGAGIGTDTTIADYQAPKITDVTVKRLFKYNNVWSSNVNHHAARAAVYIACNVPQGSKITNATGYTIYGIE